ncbi:molybdopterin converting factor subunit 1 [Bacillus sp. 165]|uniref:molybdopterin converting factor subunit 1 n=1 Tax=Bacillus sp. 165 TaxID=1529117 RepID=UPI001ADD0452|nr:molybdopterin converting factor subunit 1 [Bacillus sp. 165]MBO9129182.1 molybdopterin converting factor subunit 1 [Bacillus sp. 165]
MITVLLFAHLQEAFGKERVVVEQENITISDLKALLEETYNVTISPSNMIAVNEEYAEDEEVVQSGDTVAFIPPVSGG